MYRLANDFAGKEFALMGLHVANESSFITPITPTGPALLALLKRVMGSFLALSQEFSPTINTLAHSRSFLPAFSRVDLSLASFKPKAEEKQLSTNSLVEKLQEYFHASTSVAPEVLNLSTQLANFFKQTSKAPAIEHAPLKHRLGLGS